MRLLGAIPTPALAVSKDIYLAFYLMGWMFHQANAGVKSPPTSTITIQCLETTFILAYEGGPNKAGHLTLEVSEP